VLGAGAAGALDLLSQCFAGAKDADACVVRGDARLDRKVLDREAVDVDPLERCRVFGPRSARAFRDATLIRG